MHSVWVGLTLPIMVFLVWGFSAMRRRRIWLGCLALALVGIAVVAGLDLQQFLAEGGATGDIFRRIVFKIATATDLPLVAIAIGSVANLLLCCFCWRTDSHSQQADPESASLQPEHQPEPQRVEGLPEASL